MRIIRYILGFPGGLLMVVASISEEIYKNRWFRNNVWSSGDRQLENGLINPRTYAPGLNFYKAKPLIEQSKIFQLIQEMPKGSILHSHVYSIVSSEWVIKTLTYRPDALKCVRPNGQFIFTFRHADWHNCSKNAYVNIVQERKKAKSTEAYDRELEKFINLSLMKDHSDINSVWSYFQPMFETIRDLINYEEVIRQYHNQALQEMYHDNIMYIEYRTRFSSIYNKYGVDSTKDYSVEVLRDVINDFKKIHPDFVGLKGIYSVERSSEIEEISDQLTEYNRLQSKYPDMVVGFDFQGQEDLGTRLYNLSDLVMGSENKNFFFHAGETNSIGFGADLNLYDAILLNTKRIGHGFSLPKHPILMKIVKDRQIPIEVCPISNQVLKLVDDLRNHPASAFVTENMPMVISNDDPGFWNSKGVSYDYYFALMSFAPAEASLAYLKQLFINSIKFSVLNDAEKKHAAQIFNIQWDIFLDLALAEID